MGEDQVGVEIPTGVETKNSSTKRFAPVRWLWTLVPAALFFAMGYRFACPNYAESFGYLVVPVILLHYVFWKFVLRHPRRVSFWGLLIVFIWVGITGSSMGAARHPDNPHAAIYPKGQSGWNPTTVNPQSDGSSEKDARIVGDFDKALIAKAAKIRQDYERDVEASGTGNILSPQWLKTHRDLTGAKDSLTKYRTASAVYRKSNLDLWDGIDKRIRTLDISDKSKDETIEGYSRTRRKVVPVITASCDDTLAVIDEMDGIVDLLSKNKSKWLVRDGQLFFTSSSVQDAYNSHVDKIQRLRDHASKLMPSAGSE